MNHPRWRSARHAAEPLRPRLHDILAAREVDRILPPPGRHVRLPDPVNGGAAIRLLVGLAFLLDASVLGTGGWPGGDEGSTTPDRGRHPPAGQFAPG